MRLKDLMRADVLEKRLSHFWGGGGPHTLTLVWRTFSNKKYRHTLGLSSFLFSFLPQPPTQLGTVGYRPQL